MTFVGVGTAFTNDALADDGNAALALNLLGATPSSSGSRRDPRRGAGRRTAAPTCPTCCRRGSASSSPSWSSRSSSLALWRGRRLGPLVAEPLPVVVRAAETTEGRARLYRRARARGRAAGTCARRRWPGCVGRSACRRRAAPSRGRRRRSPRAPAGRPADVAALLYGAAPADDAGARPPRRTTLDDARERGTPTVTQTRRTTGSRRRRARQALLAVRTEVAKAVVGQDAAVTGLVIALLVPRPRAARGRARASPRRCSCAPSPRRSPCDTKRVQFTPDLMPGDVTGSLVYDARTAEFSFREGPVFTNLLLADEINRTPPKTQAALLEAMEERQVSVDGVAAAAARPVPRRRDAEPGRVRGHLPAARGAARPVPAQADRAAARARRRDRGAAAGTPPASTRATSPPPGVRAGRRRRPSSPPARAAVAPGAGRARGARLRRRPRAAPPAQSPSLRLGVSPARRDRAAGAPRAPGPGCPAATTSPPTTCKALARPALRHRVQLRPEAELEGVTADGVLDAVLAAVPVPR